MLRTEGLNADGRVGDMRPLHAINDALMDFKADLIVISTHPEKRSRWMRHGLVEQAERRFAKPVIHVVSTAVAVPH